MRSGTMRRIFLLTVFMLLGLLLNREPTIGLNAPNAHLLELPNSADPCGPDNNHCEENDTPNTAYGPLDFGAAYQAYPDDIDDYYYFELSLPESVNVSVSDFAPTSSNGTVALYGPADGDEKGPQIDAYGSPGHTSMSLGPHRLGPGKYFVHIYTASDHSTTEPYSLTVAAQTTRVFMPLAPYNYPPNLPPDPPADPTPADGATDQSVHVNLTWTGGDPDGDRVTHDVYLAADDTQPSDLACEDVSSTSCDPGTLNPGTHYYWQVVTTDERGATTTGPVWHFVTKSAISRFVRWRATAGDFAGWQRVGTRLSASGALELDPATALTESDPYAPGTYYGRNYYNGGTFQVGEAQGPVVQVPTSFTQAVASWNADTPPGTWVETQIRARLGGRWTRWYSMGIWAAGTSTVDRHSVRNQGDADGDAYVDTLVIKNATELNAYQLRARLFSENGTAVPVVRNSSVTFSETPEVPDALTPGNPDRWDRVLDVPECSQMVYPDGGRVWCSPTSTSMVLAYWIPDARSCEPRVRDAVAGVYDWLYDGHGNWPFNAAYAATHGLEAYVARFTSFAEVEEWIAAGVPVVVSLAWGTGELTGAPLAWSDGHLMVVVGFDASGDPVVNDPAAPSDQTVQRTYIREQFESLWLEHTSGTAYLIYPSYWTVPHVPAAWGR
jgi:hypothetical protein